MDPKKTAEQLAQDEADLLAEMRAGDGDAGTETMGESRLEKLNRIANKADADRADELADVNDDDTTVAFKAKNLDVDGNEVVDEAAAAEAAAAASDAAAAAARAEAEATAASAVAAEAEANLAGIRRKIKVNGVEREITADEAFKLAEKVAGADDKFQEAARLRAEAESLAASGATRKDAPADDSEELLVLARALQVGTDEEAVAALRKLKGGAPPPSIKLDEVYQAIDAKLAFNDANRIFEGEFPDIVADKRLERMVLERDKELIESGDRRPYLTRYREIGGEIREWRKSLAGPAAAPPPPDPLVEKEVRKASAPAAPPVASGRAKQVAEDDEPEESVHDTIAKMRDKRGGPQWARA